MSRDGGMDPSIAALLQDSAENDMQDSDTEVLADDAMSADLSSFSSEPKAEKKASDGVPDVDLSVRSFKPIEKYFEQTPNPVFNDPAYYKTTLGGEGEAAQRLHGLLVKYLNCTDKKDRTVYRQQIVTAYWNFLRSLAPKMSSPRTPLCKRLALRFGVVLPSLFSPEQKEFFSRVIMDNQTGEPVLYVDEWMREIACGRLEPSTTDEIPIRGKGPAAEQQRLQALKSKNDGKIQSTESLVNVKEGERANLEFEMKEKVNALCEHGPVMGLDKHSLPYTDIQKKMFGELGVLFRQLQRVDRELANYLNELQEAKEIEQSLDEKVDGANEVQESVDSEVILSEMGTVRQMAKMTCGRQGNQFPVFTREFFHCTETGTGFRENVLRELAWIESIDPNCFVRIHKNMPNRIVPYVLLVPTYGDSGFCWEPFNRMNRVTSRGRIVIPMYPRDLKIACLTAVADLRWQVAKEKASFDWMSDGLTGQYYQYIDSQKLKGDLKSFFIADYILWITKESTGAQKLPKEVRAIFWRFMPFPQEMKDRLKMMSLTYQELYQRDINRSMSDGY
ncbi:MAG TPA: hypothetical protein DDW78_04700 [Treponema sp.]|nr:hypothetical protein [Treponema sp.]